MLNGSRHQISKVGSLSSSLQNRAINSQSKARNLGVFLILVFYLFLLYYSTVQSDIIPFSPLEI